MLVRSVHFVLNMHTLKMNLSLAAHSQVDASRHTYLKDPVFKLHIKDGYANESLLKFLNAFTTPTNTFY